MRSKLLLFLLFCTVQVFSQTGFVHIQDQHLVDGTDRSVKLNGINLGGWLLWEGWIWGGKFKSETHIRERMEELFGKEQSDKYIEQYRASFITAADIKAIADLGMNTVRVPFNHSLIEKDDAPGVIDENGFRYLDSVVSWCKQNRIYAVIDLHAAPGGQSPWFISDPDKKNMWKDPQNIKRTFTVWKAIAQRYKNETSIAGYDLLNEPIPSPKNALIQFYKQLVDTLRTIDKNHLLIIEGGAFATDFGMFGKPLDANQLFSFHFYTWFVKDAAKKLQKYDDFSRQVKVPMWCGEWGEDKEETIKRNASLLKAANYNFCGNAIWTWKKAEKDFKRPAINSIPASEEQWVLMNWLAGSGKRPSATSAKKGLEDFLMNITYQQNKKSDWYYSKYKLGEL